MAEATKIHRVKGPKNRRILELDSKYVAPCYTRSHYTVFEKGKGVEVWDVEGNRYLDFAAGIAVVATGHCHPKVVKAIRDQAGKLIHMSGTDFFYEAQVKLAEKLAEITPGGKNKRVFFGNSGAEAVEACLKLEISHQKTQTDSIPWCIPRKNYGRSLADRKQGHTEVQIRATSPRG